MPSSKSTEAAPLFCSFNKYYIFIVYFLSKLQNWTILKKKVIHYYTIILLLSFMIIY